jgi:ribosomal protein S18 acetylase RimI-like enzyme
MIRIEPATEQDIDALCGLLQQLFAIEADFHFDVAKTGRALQQLINNNRACVLVAREDDKVIGMCTAQLVISTAEGAYSAWVEDVVIDSQQRGNGVGKQLLNALGAWAKGQGATRLQLLADMQNQPALAFYRNNGWQPLQLQAWRTMVHD